MNAGAKPVPPGLHLVATPIGAARDITLRALDILAGADVIAAEDTRTARKLMELHGIPLGSRSLVAYHDHSGPAVRDRLIGALRDGRSVAYVSEAGTPLVSDPGFALAREAIGSGLPVLAAPGPSALLAALSVAGLPTDRFFFAGFPPPKREARRAFLAELKGVPGTLVFYESPNRVATMLADCAEVLGDRDAALARELTKRFEEVRRGSLTDLAEGAVADPPKGEIVVLVDRERETAVAGDLDSAIAEALSAMSVKDAATAVAGALGLPKREVYQRALELAKGR